MVYDLLIIGGGPAGYLAAERAGHAGLSVLLIEKRQVGGVCLNEGCIPSKVFLYSAKVLESARHGAAYGVNIPDEQIAFDHQKVLARKQKTIRTLVAGIKSQLKKNGVELITGIGKVLPKEGEYFAVGVEDTVYLGKNLLLATGSIPVMPPIPGLQEQFDQGFVVDNRGILDLPVIPERLAIIGGGVIGLEMAAYYQAVGSQVTVIEMQNRIAGATDKEVSQILMKNYQKKGVTFILGAKVTEIQPGIVLYEKDGESADVPCDKVLLSIGRRADTNDLGLENIGVALERGAVVIDEIGRTNVPGVYAAGDINGHHMLAHVAYREAEVVVNHLTGKEDVMRYHAVPAVIYTHPEVASVGETAESARAKGIEVEEVSLSMRFSGRYLAENEGGDGICKLVAEKNSQRLLGATVIGSYSSEFIVSVGVMIEQGMTVDEAKKIIFPHPTVCEIIREGIFMFD